MTRKNACPRCLLLSLFAAFDHRSRSVPSAGCFADQVLSFSSCRDRSVRDRRRRDGSPAPRRPVRNMDQDGEDVSAQRGQAAGSHASPRRSWPWPATTRAISAARTSITTVTTVTTIRTDLATKATTTASTTTTETRAPGQVPEKFAIPQPFFKSPSCLIPHEAEIVLPKDSRSVQYEGELVIVIGKKAQQVPQESALDYVLGVTCGLDVSERIWQKNDIQWWRAKGSDTFGPCGPFIASGIDYDNLALQLRLNGEVKQKDQTSQLIHNVAAMVSTISRYITLHPGDLIFTGTPGETTDLKPGDIVEVEIEGIGVLRNRVVAGR